ncbi:MAG: hypothetical protein K5852_05085 [Eubacterium sp.]|nr:hypothetical protein [Eubacterium sp.]
MITDNTIRADNGAQVYEHRIYEIVDQYLDGALTDAERDEPKIDSTLFTGLLHRIYTAIFKPSLTNKPINTYQNVRQNSILDYNDIGTLDHLFDIYCDLCAKYRMCPSLLQFGSMIGLSKETINDFINGTTHNQTAHRQTAKHWKSVCESALENRAVMSNSIGAIFGLKAAHGWRENDPVNEPMINTGVRLTPEQIAEKYKDIPKPEIPVLEEL